MYRYLEEGRFVDEHHEKMFVGTTDNQTADLRRLAARLGIAEPVSAWQFCYIAYICVCVWGGASPGGRWLLLFEGDGDEYGI
jgi:hypothetical protein